MDYRRLIKWVTAAAVALFFALFIWPTPWTYYVGERATMIRVHRVTGEVEWAMHLDPWTPIRASP